MEPELTSPEMIPAVLGAAAGVAVLAAAWGLHRPRARRGHARVAHTERLHLLPSYRRAVRRRRFGLVLSLVPIVAAIALCGYIAARPAAIESRRSQLDNRDIVLCLDVSGSMSDENLAIVRTFRRLVSDLQGERIALVVFNTYSRATFPLTDDYDLVRTQLELAEEDLAQSARASTRTPDLARGVTDPDLGQSFVGDGLMGCTQQFAADERAAELRGGQVRAVERSRIVILATDNEQLNSRGGQLFTVTEAAQQARALDAIVVALAAENNDSADVQELSDAALATGGAVYPASSGDTAIDEISTIVEGLESTTIQGPVVTSRFDVPGPAVGALLAVAGVMLLTWRVMRP